MQSVETPADGNYLAGLMRGHIITQLIASAVRFGIPDLLATGPVPAAELSARTGIGPSQLPRFMRALAGIGLVTVTETGDYQGTELGSQLQFDAGGLRGQALMSGRQYYEAWAELDFALRTGRSAFEKRHGADLWATMSASAEVAASFTRTMRWNMERALPEILDLYSFPETGIVADLGAGDGTLCAGLLVRFPGLRAIILEQASVIGQVRQAMRDRGLADRCNILEGSFLERVPRGADLYILKSVVHNWDDDAAVRILANCREAMSSGARLLVIERAMKETDLLGAAVRDLTMLVLFGSMDRTTGEYRELVERAGFRVTRVAAGPSGICVLEAAP
jgi:hypothetical protein